MRKIIVLLFVATLFMVACDKNGTITPDQEPLVDETKVNLSQLIVGQQSIFKKYTTTCGNVIGDFSYTGDVLTLAVIADNGQLYFQETLTPESPMVVDSWREQVVRYPVVQQKDRLLLTDRLNSSLFFFYGNDTIFLNQTPNVLLKQDACKLLIADAPFIGNEFGRVINFELGPLQQKNKMAVSCVPLFEIDAYLIYDNQQLHMSHTVQVETFWEEIIGERVEGWVVQE